MRKVSTRMLVVSLAVCVCVSMFSFMASATQNMTVQVSSVTADPGDTVQVQITLANNPGIASLKASVRYDSILTLTDVSFNSAFGS